MLFVLALIGAVVAFYLYNSSKKKGIKAQATFSFIGLVIAILIAFTQLFAVIPAGHSGVKDFFGSVSDKTLGPGINFVNPMANVVKFDTRKQEIKEVMNVPSKEGMSVELETSMIFQLKTDKVNQIYKTAGNYEEYLQKLVIPNFRSVIRGVTTKYEAKALYTAELIRKKRNNENLTKDEILFLVNNFTNNKIPDYQFSAFLMSVYFNGMDKAETSALTEAMLYSGMVLNLSSIKGIKIDKHSTGGVGDKTSLILAPIAAAAGVKVPMISGRGLGHSGGTLDKLEAIPGFKTDLTLSQYKKVLQKVGAVLIGQTKEIAPADKLIYALRDVTATVESIPLITGSIMSKKLAEGIDGLVLDVKTGNGAFMQRGKDAVALANSLIETAKAFNKKVIGFVTDMNQPLGNYIGNWLEVYESIQVLRDGKKNDLTELSLILAGAMIFLGKKAASLDEGIEAAIKILKSGKAFDKFVEIVKAQNGKADFVIHPEKYPKPKFNEAIKSNSAGYLSEVNTYELGMAAIDLGAGRKTKADKIDPKAGIIFNYKIGDTINKNVVLAEIFSDSKAGIESAKKRIEGAIKISKSKSKKFRLIKKVING